MLSILLQYQYVHYILANITDSVISDEILRKHAFSPFRVCVERPCGVAFANAYAYDENVFSLYGVPKIVAATAYITAIVFLLPPAPHDERISYNENRAVGKSK